MDEFRHKIKIYLHYSACFANDNWTQVDKSDLLGKARIGGLNMDENKRQVLVSLSRDYLESTIRFDLGTRMPNAIELAKGLSKLVCIVRIYYIDAAISRGLISSRDDKEALAIFDSTIDDYIFGKILDPMSQVRREPVKSPMEFISGDAKASS